MLKEASKFPVIHRGWGDSQVLDPRGVDNTLRLKETGKCPSHLEGLAHCVCRWAGGSPCWQTQGLPSRWVFCYPSCSQTGTWSKSTIPSYGPCPDWSWPEKLSGQMWLGHVHIRSARWTPRSWAALLPGGSLGWVNHDVAPLQGSKRGESAEWGY